MKYLVILVLSEDIADGPDGEENLQFDTQPVLCADVVGVFEAIREARTNSSLDWSLWELVPGKQPQRRSVTHPYDLQRMTIS